MSQESVGKNFAQNSLSTMLNITQKYFNKILKIYSDPEATEELQKWPNTI